MLWKDGDSLYCYLYHITFYIAINLRSHCFLASSNLSLHFCAHLVDLWLQFIYRMQILYQQRGNNTHAVQFMQTLLRGHNVQSNVVGNSKCVDDPDLNWIKSISEVMQCIVTIQTQKLIKYTLKTLHPTEVSKNQKKKKNTCVHNLICRVLLFTTHSLLESNQILDIRHRPFFGI